MRVYSRCMCRPSSAAWADIRGWSIVFEEAGAYSLLGPQALNCAAPDEGNMHLLEVVATDEQKERYPRRGGGGSQVMLCDDRSRTRAQGPNPAARHVRSAGRRRGG